MFQGIVVRASSLHHNSCNGVKERDCGHFRLTPIASAFPTTGNDVLFASPYSAQKEIE